MSKLSNELLMIQLLSNGRKYSIKELSNILEVSERMVRCYKEEIEKYFGEGSCHVLKVRKFGGMKVL